ELAADRGLLVVVRLAGEYEVIVGDGRLPRIDRVAAGDLVEGVNRERGRPVGRGQEIRVNAKRRPRRDLGVLVDAVRPHDLLGRRRATRGRRIRPLDPRRALEGRLEFAAADGEDAAAAPDLVFLRAERDRLVGLLLRLVGQPPRRWIEAELVAVTSIG